MARTQNIPEEKVPDLLLEVITTGQVTDEQVNSVCEIADRFNHLVATPLDRLQAKTARKPHVCDRCGVNIPAQTEYFSISLGGGYGNNLEICIPCGALILFSVGAYNLEPSIKTQRRIMDEISKRFREGFS